jgi:hypothetical protein
MKKTGNLILLILAIALILFAAACANEGNNPKAAASDTDTLNRVTPPPSDNSHATNPSLADTVYHKKDSAGPK